MVKIKKKYFGTDGIRGKLGTPCINPEFILKLGWAIGKVLGGVGQGPVLIGKDTRISGYMFESALEAGLSSAGMDIHLLGPMPTPAIAYLTRTLRAQAGIVISASHNQFHDNGIKFFASNGRKLSDALELAIERQLDRPLVPVESAFLGKATRIVDAPGRYIEFCKSVVPTSFQFNGIKVVLDCAHGATYHIAPNIFRELGAHVIPISVEPDGLNINQACGSTAPEALQRRVLLEKADLGIAFDGDGDRVIMVDQHGQLLDGDDILYVIAQHLHRKQRLSDGVVGTVMTNQGIECATKAMGLDFVRTPVGDRYIMEELIKRGWFLGGENSGHVMNLKINQTGDGIVAALQVMTAMVDRDCGLADLLLDLNKFPQVNHSVAVNNPATIANSPRLQQEAAALQSQLGSYGKVLIRPSGTEPLVRIMIEGEHADKIQAAAVHLTCLVKEHVAEATAASF